MWWYREASDDQGASEPLRAKIILNEPGKYKVKAYVMDDEFVKRYGTVDLKKEKFEFGELTVKSKSSGSLYYFYLVLFLMIVLIIFLSLSGLVGSPLQMFNLVKEDKGLLIKPIPLLYMAMIASFIVLIFYWNFMGIGYAGYEDYLHSPNWFFSTEDVIYIG